MIIISFIWYKINEHRDKSSIYHSKNNCQSCNFNNSFPKNCSCSPTEHSSMQKRCAPVFPRVCLSAFLIGQSMQYVSISSSISLMTALLSTNSIPLLIQFLYFTIGIFSLSKCKNPWFKKFITIQSNNPCKVFHKKSNQYPKRNWEK